MVSDFGPRQLLFGATMAMDGSSAVVVASAALGDGRLLFGVAALHGGACGVVQVPTRGRS